MRNNIIIAVVVIALASGGTWWILSGPSNTGSAPLYTVKTQDLTETVTDEGVVKPVESVDLGFDRGGTIASVGPDVGAHVAAGTILASLDATDLEAQRAQAAANVDTQKALLAKLENGTRPEDLQIAQAQAASAQTAVISAQQSLADTISSAYTTADDVITNKTDVLYSLPITATPQLIALTFPNAQLQSTVASERQSLIASLDSMQHISVDVTPASADTNATSTGQILTQIQTYLRDLATLVNSAIPNQYYSQTNIDTYKTTIGTARTAIDTTITALSAAQQGLAKTQAALDVAQKQLALSQAGATSDDIDAQKAAVASAEAAEAAFDAQIAKTVIRAPIGGIISRQDAKIGQIVTPNAPLVSIISDARFEIETYVPETDVAKITTGDIATVTLDAYGSGTTFPAKVITIDPDQTLQNGSPTYKVTLQFASQDDRVRSGMTANVTITTAQKTGVIAVPARSVFQNGNSYFVRKYNGTSFDETPVQVGITSADGMDEITQGLSAGDQIESFTSA